MKLTPSFSLAELTVTGSGLPNIPNATERACLLDLCENILQPLRDYARAPIVVSSGFRSDAVNRAAGGAKTSQHTLGQAADFNIAGMSPQATCAMIVRLGLPFDQLIQEFGRWVHVSYGPRDRRQILTAKKVLGVTRYLPGLV